MQLTFKDGKFIAISTYDEKDISKRAGFRWSPEAKCWWTDDIDKATKLGTFADKSAIAELERQSAEKQAKLDASKATDANIEIPVPDGLAYMPFQKAGIAFAYNKQNVLIADDMGLGKTIQALGTINMLGKSKVLIVCPASLKLNWKREAEKWLTFDATIGVGNGSYPDTDIVILNYDILEKFSADIRKQEWDVLICDESHYLKNPKAKRTIQVLGKYHVLDPISAKRKIFLTGTPILNKPIELWPLVHALGLFKNWKYYVEHYCDAHQGRFGWRIDGASNLNELQDKLRTSIMIRRLKSEVLTDLPAKRRQIIEIPSGPDYAKVLQREKDALHKYKDTLYELKVKKELAKTAESDQEYQEAVAKLKVAVLSAFQEMAATRHDTALAKLPAVMEHIDNCLESDGKIVVFAHHHDVVNQLAAKYGKLAVVLTGETPPNTRQGVVDKFQNDVDVRIFIGSITAAGLGITLTASSHVIFAELDWVPANMSQAEDRTHRIGQKNSVLVQHLVLENSLDAVMAKRLVAKQAIIDQVLDKKTEEIIDPINEAEELASRKEIADEAETISQVEINAIHDKLRILAGLCDGAKATDGMGFNKFDARIGHELAALNYLTPKQAILGRKLVIKYRRQLNG